MKSVFGTVLYAFALTLALLWGGCEQPGGAAPSVPPVRYTITFESCGGSAVAAITAAAGTAVAKPADPVKGGFVFTGWFNAETGGVLYAWPHTLNAHVTMYAQWRDSSEPEPGQYTITFDSSGGSAVAAITAAVGTAVAKPADPVKDGFVFTGWFNAETGGVLYAWPHTLNAGVTMYAQWRAESEPPAASGNAVLLIALWVNEDGGILVSGNDVTISKTGAGSLPGGFTAEVSGTYSGVRWYLNGSPIAGSRGTAQSITLSAAEYSAGTYRLGATVTKDGGLYSTDLRFTVVE